MMIPGVQSDEFSLPDAGKPGGILDKDDFLKLLVMQLRHQDPLSPLEGTEFAAQLAHFSSVEQLSNINSNLMFSLDANYLLTQSINNALATTFIGKEVRASADRFFYTGEGDVTLGYNLANSADTVVVKVYDEMGNLVKTLNGDGSKGENAITWDGTNENNHKLDKGKYSFTVEAKDKGGAEISVEQYILGKVEGVRFKDNGTFFIIGGVEIALSNIREILEG